LHRGARGYLPVGFPQLPGDHSELLNLASEIKRSHGLGYFDVKHFTVGRKATELCALAAGKYQPECEGWNRLIFLLIKQKSALSLILLKVPDQGLNDICVERDV